MTGIRALCRRRYAPLTRRVGFISSSEISDVERAIARGRTEQSGLYSARTKQEVDGGLRQESRR